MLLTHCFRAQVAPTLVRGLTWVAGTLEAALGVIAGRVKPTARDVLCALINVEAVLVGLREASPAGAHEASGRVAACLIAAGSALNAFVDVCKDRERRFRSCKILWGSRL